MVQLSVSGHLVYQFEPVCESHLIRLDYKLHVTFCYFCSKWFMPH